MKKSRIASGLALAGIVLCCSAPKLVDAGYYNQSICEAFFTCDTSVSSDRQSGHVYSENQNCGKESAVVGVSASFVCGAAA